MFTPILCRFGHSFVVAYDENPMALPAGIKNASDQTVARLCVYSTVNHIYCKRCGRLAPTDATSP